MIGRAAIEREARALASCPFGRLDAVALDDRGGVRSAFANDDPRAMFVANGNTVHMSGGRARAAVRDGLPAAYRIAERRRIPAPARCDDLPHISVWTPSGVPTSLRLPGGGVSRSVSAYSLRGGHGRKGVRRAWGR
jgi:hypothetical protein